MLRHESLLNGIYHLYEMEHYVEALNPIIRHFVKTKAIVRQRDNSSYFEMLSHSESNR